MSSSSLIISSATSALLVTPSCGCFLSGIVLLIPRSSGIIYLMSFIPSFIMCMLFLHVFKQVKYVYLEPLSGCSLVCSFHPLFHFRVCSFLLMDASPGYRSYSLASLACRVTLHWTPERVNFILLGAQLCVPYILSDTQRRPLSQFYHLKVTLRCVKMCQKESREWSEWRLM